MLIFTTRRTRFSTGLISIVAAATTTLCWTLGTNKTARIVKLVVRNRAGANIDLTIGYTTLGAVWTPVAPNFQCLAGGGPDIWTELELPPMGNTPFGFQADTTAVTGTAGNIQVRSSAAAAAPADVQVMMEIEEY